MIKDIFELSSNETNSYEFNASKVPQYALNSSLVRGVYLLPNASEKQVIKHYNDLTKATNDIDCIGLRNDPKLFEIISECKGFKNIHPLQRSDTIQGNLAILSTLSIYLLQILGMDAITMQPTSVEQGEYTAFLLIKQFLALRGDKKRNKIIVSSFADTGDFEVIESLGFEIVKVEEDLKEGITVQKLKKVLGNDVAALKISMPNKFGYCEKNIREIQKLVHHYGALMYLDGANMSGMLGVVRPGDMGFDIMHFDLEKAFALADIDGLGCTPVACSAQFQDYLPNPRIVWNERLQDYRYKYIEKSMGKVIPFYGNIVALEKALSSIFCLGSEGIKDASEVAIIGANYLMASLNKKYKILTDRKCMNTFTISKDSKVDLDKVANTLIENKICYPTKNKYGLAVEIPYVVSKNVLDRVAKFLNEM